MLKGKSAIVTGSTSGIGLGIAQGLAAQGANIVINGFGDAAAIEKERAGIESKYGVKCVYSPADVTKFDDIEAMVKLCETSFGGVGILVNNAGITKDNLLLRMSEDDWDLFFTDDVEQSE